MILKFINLLTYKYINMDEFFPTLSQANQVLAAKAELQKREQAYKDKSRQEKDIAEQAQEREAKMEKLLLDEDELQRSLTEKEKELQILRHKRGLSMRAASRDGDEGHFQLAFISLLENETPEMKILRDNLRFVKEEIKRLKHPKTHKEIQCVDMFSEELSDDDLW